MRSDQLCPPGLVLRHTESAFGAFILVYMLLSSLGERPTTETINHNGSNLCGRHWSTFRGHSHYHHHTMMMIMMMMIREVYTATEIRNAVGRILNLYLYMFWSCIRNQEMLARSELYRVLKEFPSTTRHRAHDYITTASWDIRHSYTIHIIWLVQLALVYTISSGHALCVPRANLFLSY